MSIFEVYLQPLLELPYGLRCVQYGKEMWSEYRKQTDFDDHLETLNTEVKDDLKELLESTFACGYACGVSFNKNPTPK